MGDELIDLEEDWLYRDPKFSVYLACSLTSGDSRQLKEAVLTGIERVFLEAGFDVHNPRNHTPPGSPHTPAEVYFGDLACTITSDLIFFNRLGRSLGMGIEAQIGADVLLPWGDTTLANDSYTLSPLLSGLCNAPGIFRGTVNAGDVDQFYLRLAQVLRDPRLLERLAAARRERESAQALVNNLGFSGHVRFHRLIRGLSTKALGNLTDIDPFWIQAIECNSRYSSKLTLIQVARLCDTLQLRFGPPRGQDPPVLPTVETPVGVSSAMLAETTTFVNYSFETASPPTIRPTDDALMLRWQRRLAEKNLPFPRYEPPATGVATGPIRIAVCPPVSNVTPDEKNAVARLVDEIRKSLEGSGAPVAVEMLERQEVGRRDQGPKIYLDWVARLRTTDLAVALLDPPATGVGIMLQLFQNATIPCLCIAKRWSEVSRMVMGLAPAHMDHIEYKSTKEFAEELASWLRDHAKSIMESRSRRERAWTNLSSLSIQRATALAGIVGSPVAEMQCLREEFLQHLVAHEHMIGAVTLLQLAYVLKSQNWNAIPDADGKLVFEPSLAGQLVGTPNREAKLMAARISLANLVDALESCRPTVPTAKAATAWSIYLHELTSDAARGEPASRTTGTYICSKKQWLRNLTARDEL
jgi:hypothetical protein